MPVNAQVQRVQLQLDGVLAGRQDDLTREGHRAPVPHRQGLPQGVGDDDEVPALHQRDILLEATACNVSKDYVEFEWV